MDFLRLAGDPPLGRMRQRRKIVIFDRSANILHLFRPTSVIDTYPIERLHNDLA